MSSKIRKQRIKCAQQLLKDAFQYYSVYIPTEELLARVAQNIYSNKNKYNTIYSKRTNAPLVKMTGNPMSDKRLIICYLRRIAKIINHCLLIKRSSVIKDNKPSSIYSYCLLKPGEKSKIPCI